MLRTVTAPEKIASYYIASNAMLFIVPWVVRWAMCIRIASFYPESLAAARKRFAIILFPAIMQIVNLVLFCIVLQDGYRTVKDAGQVTGGRLSGYRLKLDLILYGAVLLSSLYYTLLLLPKFLVMGRSTSHSLGSPSLLMSGPSSRSSIHRAWAFTKQLLYAVSFSYLLPTLFDIALIVVFCTVQGRTLGFMLVINVYVHVFGGTLACLSSAGKWTGKQGRFYPKEIDSSDVAANGGGGDGAGGCGSITDRRRLSELATASGIQGNSSSGRLRNFHHLRAYRNSNDGGGRNSSSNRKLLSLPQDSDGGALHPVTTIGGGGMGAGDVRLAMPPSMPISESKLLLHQRRRVSLAIPSSSEKEDPYSSYHFSSGYSAFSSNGGGAVGSGFGASAGGGCTCGAAARSTTDSAMNAPPAHIDLPPPSSSLNEKGASGSSSASGSSGSLAEEKRKTHQQQDGQGQGPRSPPAHQKRRTPDNDLSPRSLDPHRITHHQQQRGGEEQIQEEEEESSNDDTLVLRERPAASGGGGRRRILEDAAAATGGGGGGERRIQDGRLFSRNEPTPPNARTSSATSPLDRGDRQQEILLDEDDAAAAAQRHSRQENRRSSDATLLNPSSSMGTPTSGVLH
jgi:hypothetical protein